MLRIFLWIMIAVLAGALVWLLLSGEPGRGPSQPDEAAPDSAVDASPPPSETAERTQKPTDQQAGTPADTDAGRDVLRLKSGKILRGRLVSQNADYVDFQVVGSKEVIRFPRGDIACEISERESPAAASPREKTRPATAAEDDGEDAPPEKPVSRMTAKEAQEYELKKRAEQHRRNQKRGGGIRAINIARDVRDEVERKSKGEGFDDEGKEE